MKKIGILLMILFCWGAETHAEQSEQTGIHVTLTQSVRDTLFHHFTDSTSAVSVASKAARIQLNNVSFESNVGRGLLLEPQAQVSELKEALFVSNLSGGMSIHNRSVLQTMENVSFIQNQAANGAGIYLFEGAGLSGNIQRLYFLQNEASEKGGGLYITGPNIQLSETIFDANQAQQGGAIYAAGEFHLEANQLIFQDNAAVQGGAVYAEGPFSLSGGNILFTGNKSTLDGSAIYAREGISLLAIGGDIVFQNNEKTAVFLEDERALLTLRPTSSGNIIFDDSLGASGTLRLAVHGEGTGQVVLNKPLSHAHIALKSGSLQLNPDYSWQNITLSAQGGKLKTDDSQIGHLHIGTLSLQSDLKLQPKVDLQHGKMDSFSFDAITGNGRVIVENFLLDGTQAEEQKKLPFIYTDADLAVVVPPTAYNQLYAYDTAYNATEGSISFVLKTDRSSVRSFNPAVLMQPAAAYGSLLKQLKISTDLLASQTDRFLRYEDAASSFYLQPFYDAGEMSFSNDLTITADSTGFSGGWYSQDLGWFRSAATVLGLHAGTFNSSFRYSPCDWTSSAFLGGISLHIYKDGFFGIGGLFAGQNKQKLTSWETSQNEIFAGASLLAGYQITLDDGSWFLQPYGSIEYGWQGKGKDLLYNGVTLTAQDTAAVGVQGGVKLMKSYNDCWHWQTGAALAKYFISDSSFRANQQELPGFGSELIYEINMGLGTEGSGRWGLKGEGYVRLGAETSVGGLISLSF